MQPSILQRNKYFLLIPFLVLLSGLWLGISAQPLLLKGEAPCPPKMHLSDCLVNNLTLMSELFLGSLKLGLPSIESLFTNGIFIGITIGNFLDFYPLHYALLALFPHALFELSGFILAGAISIKSVYYIYSLIRNKTKIVDVLREALLSFILASLLISIAAIIEVYISQPLSCFLIGGGA